MIRFYISNLDDFDGACEALDSCGVKFELDGGDRIMVEDELRQDALSVFDEYDIDAEEVWTMLRPNKISPKKPCPFCGAFLENQAPSVLWCHPQNGCLLSLRAIAGDNQIAQWDTRYGETAGKSNVNCEE